MEILGMLRCLFGRHTPYRYYGSQEEWHCRYCKIPLVKQRKRWRVRLTNPK